jgi:hypothetical protein
VLYHWNMDIPQENPENKSTEAPIAQEQQGVATTPETAIVPETPQPAQTQQQPPQQDPAQADTTTQGQAASTQVVDKTEEITELHDVKETADNLTKFADEEEEEFIQEVETAHGHN